jgi:hypothetical protein
MSEREYIETLLARAEAYIAWVGQTDLTAQDGAGAEEAWWNTKQKLSAHTMRALCKVWLDADARDPNESFFAENGED